MPNNEDTARPTIGQPTSIQATEIRIIGETTELPYLDKPKPLPRLPMNKFKMQRDE